MKYEGKLTFDEARDYVRTHLKIENFEAKVKEDSLAALNEFIRTTQAVYPFQVRIINYVVITYTVYS